MIRYLSQTEVVMRLGVGQVAALLGAGVWPRMLVFKPDEQEEAVSEQDETTVTPTEGLFVRLSTGERVYWADGSTSEMTADGLRPVERDEQ